MSALGLTSSTLSLSLVKQVEQAISKTTDPAARLKVANDLMQMLEKVKREASEALAAIKAKSEAEKDPIEEDAESKNSNNKARKYQLPLVDRSSPLHRAGSGGGCRDKYSQSSQEQEQSIHRGYSLSDVGLVKLPGYRQ